MASFAVLFLCSGARADFDEELRQELLPIPSLIRPTAKPSGDDEKQNQSGMGGCAHLPPVIAMDSLGFGPGELLQFDVTMAGIRTGGITTRFSEQTTMDRVQVYPVQVHARTEGVFSLLGNIDGRMISYLSPETLEPTRMVNRYMVKKPFSDATLTKEDAVFTPENKVIGQVKYTTLKKTRTWPIKREAETDLVDVVSVVYYARSRIFELKKPFCFEIYHRRSVYIVEGQYVGLESVRVPIGYRQAHRIDTILRRKKSSRSGKPRVVKVWIGNDKHRLPLKVQTPEKLGNIEVRLKAYLPGHRLVRKTVSVDKKH
tara:strand:+ start:206 stop:1150 length:945 start_codon:yes stop_codon:yes gene_type:complete